MAIQLHAHSYFFSLANLRWQSWKITVSAPASADNPSTHDIVSGTEKEEEEIGNNQASFRERDRKVHRANAIVAPGPAQRDRYSTTSQPAPNASTSVPVSSSSNDKPPIQKQIKKLKNKVYNTQAKVAMKEKTVKVLLSHTKELKDMHDQEVHASEKLKTELSSSKAQKDKASTLLADRTDWFSMALAKKNLSLSRSKITMNKLKAKVDGVKADKQATVEALKADKQATVEALKADKQATVEALKAEVECSVEAEKDKRDEDAKSADRIREKMLNKMKVSMNVYIHCINISNDEIIA